MMVLGKKGMLIEYGVRTVEIHEYSTMGYSFVRLESKQDIDELSSVVQDEMTMWTGLERALHVFGVRTPVRPFDNGVLEVKGEISTKPE